MRTKSYLTLLLTLCLLVTMAGYALANSFTDVQDHWAAEQINKWSAEGLASGYSDGTFKPNNQVTRAEFVALVNRAFEIKNDSAAAEFADVQPGLWCYEDIAAAKAAGYIGGYTDGTFKPGQTISRQEAASILVRLLDLEPTTAGIAQYGDSGRIPEWSRGNIGAVSQNGLMRGMPDNTFQPLKSITRAEAVVSLDRALEYVPGAAQPVVDSAVEGVVTFNDELVDEVTISIFKAGSFEVIEDTATNKNGYFKVELEPGDYDITATADNEVAYKGNIEVAANKITTADLALEVAAEISGVLKDKNDRVVKKAAILFSTNPTFIAETDNYGEFTVLVLPDRTYTVRAYEPGEEDEEPAVVEKDLDVGAAGKHDVGTLNAPFSVGSSVVGGGGGGPAGGGGGGDGDDEEEVLPDGEPVSIPEDGKMKFESGVELDLSDITVNEGVTVKVTVLEDGDYEDPNDAKFKTAGKVVSIEFDGLTDFSEGVNLVFPYDDEANPDEIGIFYYDEDDEDWKYIESIVDEAKQVVSATVYHFSNWAPFEASRVETPTATPEAGKVSEGTEVELKTPTSGATIYYTNDGSNPSTNGIKYTEPIEIVNDVTIKAIAVKANMRDSEVAEFEFTVKEDQVTVSAVSITTEPEDVSDLENDATVTVTLATDTEDASIYYALDGTTPTKDSTLYEGPFTVTAPGDEGGIITVKAIGIKTGYTDSVIATKAIVFSEIEADEVTGSIARDPANTGGELESTVEGDTVTFNSGEIAWYPADEDLGRAAGNRVGVQINAPANLDTSAVKVTIGDNEYNWDEIEDGDGYFFWYPLVTEAGQEFTATVVWDEASTQEFKVVIGENATLQEEPVEPEPASLKATGIHGIHADKVYAGYELQDGSGTEIPLIESNIESISVKNPDNSTESLTVVGDSDPLLWFNIAKEAGTYTYTVVTKGDDSKTYETTIEWAEPTEATISFQAPTSAEAVFTEAAGDNPAQVDFSKVTADKLLDWTSVEDDYYAVELKIEGVDLSEENVEYAFRVYGYGTAIAPEIKGDLDCQYVTTDWELGSATMYYVLDDGLYQAKIDVVSLTPKVEEPTKSEYGFILNGADQEFVAGDLLEGSVIDGADGVNIEGLTPVEVTLKATTINELGYDNVKVLAPEVTGEGTLQFWAYSEANGQWFDAAVHGWGSGFLITADYDVTTDIYVFADTAGSYTVAFRLVDLDNENALIVERTETIKVVAALPEQSTYKLTYTGLAENYTVGDLVTGDTQAEINTAVVEAIDGLEPVKVTLATAVLGQAGYDAVRIQPVGAGENIQFWAEDTAGNWYDINVTGWGDLSGFELPADYDVTTDIYILSDEAGDYTLNIKLVDLKESNKIIAEASGTVEIVSEPQPEVIFTFNDLDDVTAGTVNFSITAKVTDNDAIADNIPLRYKAAVTKDDSALEGQVIKYPEAGDSLVDPSTWHSFTTDDNGVAYFGPSGGFTLTDLPELNSPDGVTTPFQADFTDGSYNVTVSLVDISGEEEVVLGSDNKTFIVEAPEAEVIFTFEAWDQSQTVTDEVYGE